MSCIGTLCFFLTKMFGLLRKLDLPDNQLDYRTANEASMKQDVCLTVLNLSWNRLNNILFVENLTGQSHLDLSGNNIKAIVKNEVDLLGHLMAVKNLNLSRNRIASIKADKFQSARNASGFQIFSIFFIIFQSALLEQFF